MLFLLLRILPYAVPVLFFLTIKGVFYYPDAWPFLAVAAILPPLLYFILLKVKNREKEMFFLAAFALIFSGTGFCYALLLENPISINLFLVVWSLFYGLFLEAVFHDLYETAKTRILDLRNISWYGSILCVFFLTGTLVAFDIFLNFPVAILLIILAVAYFCLLYLTLLRQGWEKNRARIYAGLIDLSLVELMGALLIWPSSFYVLAAILSLVYYLLLLLVVAASRQELDRKRLFHYLVYGGVILLAILLSANWM